MPIYIEEVLPGTLKSLIQSDDELKFKHKDCSMVFTSEGGHLYAQADFYGMLNLPVSAA